MRRREVTNSPAQEWQARQDLGRTEPLPAHIEAAILAKFTRAQVKRRMIAIQHDGKTYRYTHDNSQVILNHNDDGTKFLIRYNPLELREAPEHSVIHVHSESGRYIESLPLKGKAQWFDPESTRQEISRQRAIQQHVTTRIQTVREPVITAELERETHNAQQLRAFSTLPVPKAPAQEQQPGETTRATQPAAQETTPARGHAQINADHSTARRLQARGAAAAATTPRHTPRERETSCLPPTQGDDDATAPDFEDFADAIAELKARDQRNARARTDYRAAALAAFDDE